ncbi:hypothetical protein HDV04_001680 [Boothiomyces sp. JEL0838]|nr:hypothetical protein HDV04_001680 [Boothiomyces sp. JEL0838]
MFSREGYSPANKPNREFNWVLCATLWSIDESNRPVKQEQAHLAGNLISEGRFLFDAAGALGCFFVFPDLAVRKAGQFSPEEGTLFKETQVANAIFSDVFDVYLAKQFPGKTKPSELMKIFSQQVDDLKARNLGFGDSSFAIPTEKTVRIDAISAYDWIVDQGVNPRKIIIVGHSLGYASIADAAIGYPMVPVLLPFHGFPQLEKWIKSKIVDKWSSHLKMSSITTPILIMHGLKDFEIKPWQAEANFLEAISGRTGNKVVDDGYWEIRNRPQKAKFEHKDVQGLSITHLDHEGELWSLNSDENPVWLLRVTHAGHNNLSRHLVVKATIESWLENFPSK